MQRSESIDVPPGENRVEAALKTLFDGKSEAIPKGARVVSVKVENGTARIDLSREFSQVTALGNTGESMAQKALRATLAQFKEIDRMLVTVEGKALDSEHTDWSEPIPVRDEAAGAGATP